MKIELPQALIDKITTTKDKGLKVTLLTQELNTETTAQLFYAHSQSKLVSFEVSNEFNAKSPSKRLKNTLYVHWEQNTDRELDFEIFYRSEMEKIITHYKEKLS